MTQKMAKVLFVLLLEGCMLGEAVHSAAAEEVELSLEESVQMALDYSRAVASSQANAEAAALKLSSARRSAGPTLSWSSQAYRVAGSDYRQADFDSTYSNKMSLSIPLYTGGQIKHTIKGYRYQVNSADMGVEGAKQKVRYDAMEAYYNVLQKENLLQVAESSVNMADKQIKVLNVQFDEGTVARSDVLQMEVQRADYQQKMLGAQGDLSVAQVTLCSLLGLPEGTEIKPTNSLAYQPCSWELSNCISYALLHRPDKVAAEYAVKQANEEKETAKRGWRPSLSGVVNRQIVGKEAFKQNRNGNWEAGLELSWNLFDNGVTAANVSAARKNAEKLAADAEEIERNVRLDTQNAYLQMRVAEEKIATMGIAVKKAEKSYELASVRYMEGVDSILNVMDAQDKLVEARTNYCSALYEYNMNKAGLCRAIGIPVGINVPRYVEAELAGCSPKKAVKAAELSETNVEMNP